MGEHIHYEHGAGGVSAEQLAGFFEGWPDPPSPETHLRLLAGSDEVVLARDGEGGAILGFATAITDGVLSASIPLLEVRAAHRGQGIGRELVRRLLERLGGLYMVDLVCDESLVPFYEGLGLMPMRAMSRRRYEYQAGAAERE